MYQLYIYKFILVTKSETKYKGNIFLEKFLFFLLKHYTVLFSFTFQYDCLHFYAIVNITCRTFEILN